MSNRKFAGSLQREQGKYPNPGRENLEINRIDIEPVIGHEDLGSRIVDGVFGDLQQPGRFGRRSELNLL
jgi:hypothetical protein